jgi:hypothetical protein
MAESNRPGWLEVLGSGAAGVGTVLVLLPLLAVVFGMPHIDGTKTVGLPVLAILGIMILLGTLALVAMLYKRLELADASQPLALPQGSMRAVIALSLIVLFAIISITLYRTQAKGGEVYQLGGLSEDTRNAMAQQAGERVQGVMFERCVEAGGATGMASGTSTPPGAPDQAASAAVLEASCPPAQRRYWMSLRTSPTPESTDLAKQLLILIGTLMTSLTSYYFAARSKSEDKAPAAVPPPPLTAPLPDPLPAPVPAPTDVNVNPELAAALPASGHDHGEADGCDVEIMDVTPDDQLPPAVGGVVGDLVTPAKET